MPKIESLNSGGSICIMLIVWDSVGDNLSKCVFFVVCVCVCLWCVAFVLGKAR